MNANKKVVWIDNLRAIACLGIILLHVIAGWLYSGAQTLEEGTGRWFLDCVIVETIFRSCVPIFVMISGCLLLSPEKNFDLKKAFKYIKKMCLILLTFGLGFCIIEQFVADKLSNPLLSIANSFINLFNGNSWGHMWYVYMLVGLYLITPVIKVFLNNCDDKTLRYTLAVLFVCSSIIPTINYFFNTSISSFYLTGSFLIYLFYYMFGYFIAYKSKLNSKKVTIALVISMILNIFATSYFNLGYMKIDKYVNMFLVVFSLCTFYLASKSKLLNKESKYLSIISKYSFGIYLIHPFWLNLLNKGFDIFPGDFPIVIGETLFFVYALVFSLISCFILYRIPIIKKLF